MGTLAMVIPEMCAAMARDRRHPLLPSQLSSQPLIPLLPTSRRPPPHDTGTALGGLAPARTSPTACPRTNLRTVTPTQCSPPPPEILTVPSSTARQRFHPVLGEATGSPRGAASSVRSRGRATFPGTVAWRRLWF